MIRLKFDSDVLNSSIFFKLFCSCRQDITIPMDCTASFMKCCVTLPRIAEHFQPDRGANTCWKRLYIIEQWMATSQSTPIQGTENKRGVAPERMTAHAS